MTENGRILERISALGAIDFENLVFDCMRAIGIRNLVWRTPGADMGRDIEGNVHVRDPSGHEESQSWYIECKKHSRSIDWPTIWKKLSYADNTKADVLFLVTNSNPSPNCETQIANWNRDKKKPSIRVWRGYDFPVFLRSHPLIASCYGLLDCRPRNAIHVSQLAKVILSLTQSAYSAHIFDQDCSFALGAAAALAELASHRLNDVEMHGKFVPGPPATTSLHLSWIIIEGDPKKWEDVGLRATLAFLRHLTRSSCLHVKFDDTLAEVIMLDEHSVSEIVNHPSFQEVLFWSRIEATACDVCSNSLFIRQRN